MTVLTEEEWREIPGYRGYEASTLGRIRSWLARNGRAPRATSPRLKVTTPDKDGYLTVGLSVAGRCRTKRVAALVLVTFRGPCPDGMEVRHLNGRNTDNTLGNLVWSTHQENISDKVAHGTVPTGDHHWSRSKPESLARGERHGSKTKAECVLRGESIARSKLTAALVRSMRADRASGVLLTALATKYGVSVAAAHSVVTKRTWRHVA